MIARLADHLTDMQLQIWVLAMHNDLIVEQAARAYLNFKLIDAEASEARGAWHAHCDRMQRAQARL